MEVNLELYKVFYYVAKTLSFSEASKVLYISQSAVSQNIKLLEQKLQVSLFIRSTKKVSLTHDGELLYDHVAPAIHLLQSGESSLSETKDLTKGKLHIAASDTICRYYLIAYLEKFHRAYPQIEIRVTNRTSLKGISLLADGVVDLMVTNLPNTGISEDMNVTVTHSFQDIFICSSTFHKQNNLLSKTPLDFKTLVTLPILMLEKNSTTSQFLYQLAKAKDVHLHPAIELGSIDLLVDLARIGLGISFVPDFVCDRMDTSLIQIPIHDTVPPRHIGIVTHKKRPLSLAATTFMNNFSRI
jgi:DNA-binding transcriptional LysR family regulator